MNTNCGKSNFVFLGINEFEDIARNKFEDIARQKNMLKVSKLCY